MAKKRTTRDTKNLEQLSSPYPRMRLDKFTEEDAPAAPNVNFILPELAENLAKYEMIRDCLAGQEAIKKAGTKYLPQPNVENTTAANDTRYEGYLARAMFYNVTANTASGLVGQVFAAEPVSEFPDELDPLWDDCNGSGVSMTQQSKRTLSHVLAYGRAGILVDFPLAKEDGSAFTREEVLEGYARPTINFYGATEVINWRYKQVGAKSVLALVVLNEEYTIKDDGFEIKKGKAKRVLKLTEEGIYEMEEWRNVSESSATEEEWVRYSIVNPTDNNGQKMTYIPFTFVGSQNNDSSVDRPPLYDLACINIAHYRNSADYEDSVYMVGQPTPFFAGLTQEWVTDVLKGTIQLGSRGAVPLPAGGEAGLIQASPNGLVVEAMQTKERQMVALGAQLVEDKKVQRTLGEAKMEHASVASTLSACAGNVSAAFVQAIKWACRFYGIEPEVDEIVYQLSTDFAIQKMTPEERKTLMAEWQGGLVSFTEARSQLRQSGIATLDDEEAKKEIENDKAAAIDLDAEVETDDDGNVVLDAQGQPVKKPAGESVPLKKGGKKVKAASGDK